MSPEEAQLRTKVTMKTTLPGKEPRPYPARRVELVMCNLCGSYGVDGRDVEGPYDEGALYRCKNQPTCRKAAERLALIRSWKGSTDKREGRRVGLAGKHIVIEQLEPTLDKALRNSPALAKERIQSVEFQVRCLECDRRDTFFVNKILLAGPPTPELAEAMEQKTIEKLHRLRQLGCPHVPGGREFSS